MSDGSVVKPRWLAVAARPISGSQDAGARQRSLGARFRALHEAPEPLVVPNPWDRGTAVILEHAGFDALATTGAGHSFSEGRPDGTSDRDGMLTHVGQICAATNLPVTADLEDGFGRLPETVAATIRSAAAQGAVGGSIEDRPYRGGGSGLFDLGLAVDRVAAAADAAGELPFDFMLTARTEGHLVGACDLADTITRLQAYQEAGADVLYAPGLQGPDELRTLVRSVDRPVNVVLGLAGPAPTVDELAKIGVGRISLGSALSRVAFAAVEAAARELRERGTFTAAGAAMGYGQLSALVSRRRAAAVP